MRAQVEHLVEAKSGSADTIHHLLPDSLLRRPFLSRMDDGGVCALVDISDKMLELSVNVVSRSDGRRVGQEEVLAHLRRQLRGRPDLNALGLTEPDIDERRTSFRIRLRSNPELIRAALDTTRLSPPVDDCGGEARSYGNFRRHALGYQHVRSGNILKLCEDSRPGGPLRAFAMGEVQFTSPTDFSIRCEQLEPECDQVPGVWAFVIYNPIALGVGVASLAVRARVVATMGTTIAGRRFDRIDPRFLSDEDVTGSTALPAGTILYTDYFPNENLVASVAMGFAEQCGAELLPSRVTMDQLVERVSSGNYEYALVLTGFDITWDYALMLLLLNVCFATGIPLESWPIRFRKAVAAWRLDPSNDPATFRTILRYLPVLPLGSLRCAYLSAVPKLDLKYNWLIRFDSAMA